MLKKNIKLANKFLNLLKLNKLYKQNKLEILHGDEKWVIFTKVQM